MATKAKAKVAEEAEKAPEPIPEPEPLTGVARFKAEFSIGSDIRPLRWEPVNGANLRIMSTHGVLCFADGSQVSLPAAEAGTLASELKAIRPRDNIQLIS